MLSSDLSVIVTPDPVADCPSSHIQWRVPPLAIAILYCHISVTEKLVVTPWRIIEGLVALQNRFDRPRLLHHTHVKLIYEIPNVREGSGKELRKFHDVAQQHLRALKAMSQDPSGPLNRSKYAVWMVPELLACSDSDVRKQYSGTTGEHH